MKAAVLRTNIYAAIVSDCIHRMLAHLETGDKFDGSKILARVYAMAEKRQQCLKRSKNSSDFDGNNLVATLSCHARTYTLRIDQSRSKCSALVSRLLSVQTMLFSKFAC